MAGEGHAAAGRPENPSGVPLPRPKTSVWKKAGLGLVLAAAIAAGLSVAGIDLRALTPPNLRTAILSYGAWAPAVYLFIYAQPLILLPTSVLGMAGGLAFGPLWGTLAALAGSTLRATSQFGVARWVGREGVAKLLRGAAATFDRLIGERQFQAVLLIRLVPNVPYDLQNYALGCSQARFGPYVCATLLGNIPNCFTAAYLGHSLTDLGRAWKLTLAILLIVLVVVGPRAWKAAQRPVRS